MHFKHVFRENYLSNTALPIGTPNLKRNHILYAEYFEIKYHSTISVKVTLLETIYGKKNSLIQLVANQLQISKMLYSSFKCMRSLTYILPVFARIDILAICILHGVLGRNLTKNVQFVWCCCQSSQCLPTLRASERRLLLPAGETSVEKNQSRQ